MSTITKSEIIEDRTFPGDKRTITERHWDELGTPWLFSYWGNAATDVNAVMAARVSTVIALADEHRATPPPLPREPECLVGNEVPSAGGTSYGLFYLDSTTGNLYQNQQGGWTMIGNIKGPSGANVGTSIVPMLIPGMTASAVATNLAASTWNAVSDPLYRRLIDLRGMNTCRIAGQIGGSLHSATRIRIQYHAGGDINVASADSGWQTLADSAGSHTVNQFFLSSAISVPSGAKVENCIIRCGLFGGNGTADPTITACILNFGV